MLTILTPNELTPQLDRQLKAVFEGQTCVLRTWLTKRLPGVIACASVSGKITGICYAMLDSQGIWHPGTFTRPCWRRLGVARKLLTAVMPYMDSGWISCDTHNEAAMRLYAVVPVERRLPE